jgi:hypothetical protein
MRSTALLRSTVFTRCGGATVVLRLTSCCNPAGWLQEQYAKYTTLAAEQQLEPLSLRAFYRHSQDRGIPVL